MARGALMNESRSIEKTDCVPIFQWLGVQDGPLAPHRLEEFHVSEELDPKARMHARRPCPGARALCWSSRRQNCVRQVQPADMHVFKRTTFDGEEPGPNGVINLRAGYLPMDWNAKEGTDIWALSQNYVTVALLRPELVHETESPAGRSLIERLNRAILSV